MKYIANPVEVDAFTIRSIFIQVACASEEAGIVCGEPESAHTKEAARGDVGMDHAYVRGTWDAEGLGLLLSDGRVVTATPDMTSRMTPVVGDYWVVQADGYVYLNPKNIFERKYSAAPQA
jgi:hypothetical protein